MHGVPHSAFCISHCTGAAGAGATAIATATKKIMSCLPVHLTGEDSLCSVVCEISIALQLNNNEIRDEVVQRLRGGGGRAELQ